MRELNFFIEQWVRDHPKLMAGLVADPPTMVVVPVDVTDAMEEAADDAFHATRNVEQEKSMNLYGKEAYASVTFIRSMWAALLKAAAPTATEKGGAPDEQ